MVIGNDTFKVPAVYILELSLFKYIVSTNFCLELIEMLKVKKNFDL